MKELVGASFHRLITPHVDPESPGRFERSWSNWKDCVTPRARVIPRVSVPGVGKVQAGGSRRSLQSLPGERRRRSSRCPRKTGGKVRNTHSYGLMSSKRREVGLDAVVHVAQRVRAVVFHVHAKCDQRKHSDVENTTPWTPTRNFATQHQTGQGRM